MVKRIVQGKNFNVEEYWDCQDILTGTAIGTVQSTLRVPKNSLVSEILAYVMQEAQIATGSTVVLVVGDATDEDGLLEEQTLDCEQGKLYGNDSDERGEYLRVTSPEHPDYGEADKVQPTWELCGKFCNTDTDVIIKSTVAVAALTRQAKVRVFLKIRKLLVVDD